MGESRPSSEVNLELFEKVQQKQRAPIRVPPDQVVALYFDILGFRQLVNQSEVDWAGAVARVQNIERWIEFFVQVNPGHDSKGIITRVFSDNVYVSFHKPSSKKNIATLFQEFLWTVGFIQCALAQNGFFVRGGIAIGSQYSTDTTLFGTALVRVYLCEKQAMNPRILIDDSFLSCYHESMTESMQPKENQVTTSFPYLRADSDGKYFLDYMAAYENLPNPEFEREVIGAGGQSNFSRDADLFSRMHKRQILKGAEKAQDRRVLEKYQWVAIYHNTHVINEDKIDMNQEIWKSFEN
jgi:hypothetical protein